ncbi:hypothetical protein LCGC14_1022070 [marine sediment metagenome]|uniref:Uncharacterized protein n=1 Tax=marine sediment metagenome TaxID=412755 RepID=A0A0F9MX69_9ZZZZ
MAKKLKTIKTDEQANEALKAIKRLGGQIVRQLDLLGQHALLLRLTLQTLLMGLELRLLHAVQVAHETATKGVPISTATIETNGH